MSAIGISNPKGEFGHKTVFVGAHADFRLDDYTFPRTQSRSLRSLQWGSRLKPMHSWGELGVYGGGTLLGALAVLALFG